MKKLIALLAVLGFVPYAHAADGADFSHSGEFRWQFQKNDQSDLSETTPGGKDQTMAQRLRWGTNVRAGEKMSAHFSLVHNGTWGENADQIPDSSTAAGENQLFVNEAYMTWMVNDSWMLRAGRGSMTLADGRFVSANDYEAVSLAFDGAMASYDHEMARISLFAVKGATAATDSGVADGNIIGRFYGVSADFKTLPAWLKTANVHYVMVKADSGDYVGAAPPDPIPSEDTTRAGLTVAGDMNNVDYRANYEMYSGEFKEKVAPGTKLDVDSSMMDFEAGYTMASMMNTRVHVGYHTDSGTKDSQSATKDKTYNGFHYDRHENAGLMDILAWGNLTYTSVGFTMSPMDDMTIGANYLMFTQTEKTDATYESTGKFVGELGGPTVGNAISDDPTKDEIGTELDVWVTKKYTNNFNITARYGIFSPGDEFKAAGGKDDYTQMYLESKLTF